MKKCKACQKDIDDKAKKCPHCQTDQRNWFARHPIMTGLLGLIILVAVVSAFGASGKKDSNQASDSQTTSVAGEEKPKVEAMKINARELVDEFDANQVAAESKWKNKAVEFSAEVSNITDSGLQFAKIGATKEFSLTSISCRISDKQQLLSLKNGQTVTVQGVVGGQSLGIIEVNDCKVI